MATCEICRRELNTSDPLSLDCGGDCWGCVSNIECPADVTVEDYRANPDKHINFEVESPRGQDTD